MPTNVKCVIQFNSNVGYGWSETHYFNSSSENPDLQVRINDLINVVGPARAALLGESCNIVGFRVSYPREGEIASRANRFFIPGDPSQKGASPSVSLAVNFVDSTNTKKKITHLRGFWDSVEYDESYHPENPEGAGWNDRFIAWKSTLIGRYGWLTKSAAASVKGKVTDYLVNDDELVQFTVARVSGAAMPIGSTVTVKFAKLNQSKSVLNRALLCTVTSATTIVTNAPIAAGAFTCEGIFSIRQVVFVGYNETGSISLGERRMGRPLNLYPGRSKAHPRT